MASRKVSWEEWLKHGIYPAGSPGKDAGKPFNPSDPNLRSYYDNYSSVWDAAAEAHRIAVNSQHGFGFANSGGGGGDGGGGSARHAPSTITSEVFSPAYERPGLLDWSRYMPTDSRNILGGGYINPAALASQTGITSGQGQYYQPWAGSGGGLWDYAPPPTSLFSPFGRSLSIPAASALESGSSGSPSTSSTTNGDPNNGPGSKEGGGGAADPMAEERDMVDVNGVPVPRGYTIYNGKVMTFADAEKARQAGLIQPGDTTGDMGGWGGGDSSQGSGGSSGVGPGGVNGGVGKGY